MHAARADEKDPVVSDRWRRVVGIVQVVSGEDFEFCTTLYDITDTGRREVQAAVRVGTGTGPCAGYSVEPLGVDEFSV